MAAGRFDRRLPLPKQGRVPIKGPFNPQDRAVDAAKVLFLIVQGEDQDAVIVNGEGTWHRKDGNEWRGTAPRRGPRVGGNGMGALRKGLARGIASLGRHQAGHGLRRRTQVRTAGDRNPHLVRQLPLR